MYTLYAALGRIRRFFNNIHYVNFLSISLIFMFESMNLNEKLHIQLHTRAAPNRKRLDKKLNTSLSRQSSVQVTPI